MVAHRLRPSGHAAGVVAGETRGLGQKNGGKGWEAEEPDVVNQPPRAGRCREGPFFLETGPG